MMLLRRMIVLIALFATILSIDAQETDTLTSDTLPYTLSSGYRFEYPAGFEIVSLNIEDDTTTLHIVQDQSLQIMVLTIITGDTSDGSIDWQAYTNNPPPSPDEVESMEADNGTLFIYRADFELIMILQTDSGHTFVFDANSALIDGTSSRPTIEAMAQSVSEIPVPLAGELVNPFYTQYGLQIDLPADWILVKNVLRGLPDYIIITPDRTDIDVTISQQSRWQRNNDRVDVTDLASIVQWTRRDFTEQETVTVNGQSIFVASSEQDESETVIARQFGNGVLVFVDVTSVDDDLIMLLQSVVANSMALTEPPFDCEITLLENVTMYSEPNILSDSVRAVVAGEILQVLAIRFEGNRYVWFQMTDGWLYLYTEMRELGTLCQAIPDISEAITPDSPVIDDLNSRYFWQVGEQADFDTSLLDTLRDPIKSRVWVLAEGDSIEDLLESRDYLFADSVEIAPYTLDGVAPEVIVHEVRDRESAYVYHYSALVPLHDNLVMYLELERYTADIAPNPAVLSQMINTLSGAPTLCRLGLREDSVVYTEPSLSAEVVTTIDGEQTPIVNAIISYDYRVGGLGGTSFFRLADGSGWLHIDLSDVTIDPEVLCPEIPNVSYSDEIQQ